MGLLVGVLLWAASAVALAATVHVGVAAWACVAVGLAVVVGALAVSTVRRSGPQRVRRVLAFAAPALLAATAVVTWRVVPLLDGPLAPLVGTRSVVDAEVLASTDPQPRQGRTTGSRRTDDAWQLDASVVSMSVSGAPPTSVDLPVRVLTTGEPDGILPGSRLHLVGRLLPADALQGRAATLVAESLEILDGPPLIQGAAGSVRAALRAAVRDRPPDQAGLLPGLVVGDTTAVRPDLDSAMRDSSLAHLVAVSGGNVAIVVLLALGGVRLVGVRRGRTQVVLVALAVAAYVVLARPQPSVVRAAGMTAVVLLAVLLDARVRPLDALGWSVGALVLLDPFLALSVGFAMSAAATAGLLLLAAHWRPAADDASRLRRAWRAVVGVVAVSTAAQVAVAPLIVGIGGGVPVGGVVANLLAAPAVGPATSFGLVAALVGVVSAPLAAAIALPAAWAVGWVALVARTTAELAPPLPWPDGWYGGLLAVAVLALGAVAVGVARGPVARACIALAVVGGLLAVAPSTGVPLGASWPPAGWRVVMCDVGQGDATVLEAGEGTAVVVDAGPDPVLVDRCLRRLGVTRVPLLVLSHFHADHVEGVPGVLRGRQVDTVVLSPLAEPLTEERRVEGWTADSGVPWRVAAPGDRWTVGDVRLRVVWPARILRGEGSDPNNASVALLAEVGGVSALLGGDLETAAQEQVLATGAVGRVDVVKVPHHGSDKQAAGWAATARPRVALVGVGTGNEYGHPAAGTLATYRALGAVVGRTDLDGDLAVLLDDTHRLGLVRRGS